MTTKLLKLVLMFMKILAFAYWVAKNDGKYVLF